MKKCWLPTQPHCSGEPKSIYIGLWPVLAEQPRKISLIDLISSSVSYQSFLIPPLFDLGSEFWQRTEGILSAEQTHHCLVCGQDDSYRAIWEQNAKVILSESGPFYIFLGLTYYHRQGIPLRNVPILHFSACSLYFSFLYIFLFFPFLVLTLFPSSLILITLFISSGDLGIGCHEKV